MNYIVKTYIFFLFGLISLYPCTTAVVSGKATSDGRPLLLKNRDSDFLQNKLVYYFEGKFRFIGLVNSADKENKEVWSGFNEAGFGIMNSASYNLKINDTTKLSDQEGIIMRLALAGCKTLSDFETLLDTLPKPLGVEANFGVIDAEGGAAYYEVNNFSFIKYDVNDPEVAPNGYLIRTNFSFSGIENKGYGYIRYNTASELFADKIKDGKLNFQFLINDVPLCLVHSLTKTDLSKDLPDQADNKFVFFRDYIPRFSTSAAVVIQGVKSIESASLTTMWTVLGFPLTSIAIPVWLTDDESLPKILIADETGNAPLCNLALGLKEKVLPEQNDAKESYLNLSALMNKENTGVRQKLNSIEDEVLNKAEEKISNWEKTRFNSNDAKEFYNWIDNDIYPQLKSKFSFN